MMDFRQQVYFKMMTEHAPLSWSGALHPTLMTPAKLGARRVITDYPILCSRLYQLATTTKTRWVSEDSYGFSQKTLSLRLREIRRLVLAEKELNCTLDVLINEHVHKISESGAARRIFINAACIIQIARAQLS